MFNILVRTAIFGTTIVELFKFISNKWAVIVVALRQYEVRDSWTSIICKGSKSEDQLAHDVGKNAHCQWCKCSGSKDKQHEAKNIYYIRTGLLCWLNDRCFLRLFHKIAFYMLLLQNTEGTLFYPDKMLRMWEAMEIFSGCHWVKQFASASARLPLMPTDKHATFPILGLVQLINLVYLISGMSQIIGKD